MKKDTNVLYTYVSPMNKKHAHKVALKNNRTASEFIDELISSHRLKREVKFEPKVLKAEQKVKAAQERRKKKLNELR